MMLFMLLLHCSQSLSGFKISYISKYNDMLQLLFEYPFYLQLHQYVFVDLNDQIQWCFLNLNTLNAPGIIKCMEKQTFVLRYIRQFKNGQNDIQSHYMDSLYDNLPYIDVIRKYIGKIEFPTDIELENHNLSLIDYISYSACIKMTVNRPAYNCKSINAQYYELIYHKFNDRLKKKAITVNQILKSYKLNWQVGPYIIELFQYIDRTGDYPSLNILNNKK